MLPIIHRLRSRWVGHRLIDDQRVDLELPSRRRTDGSPGVRQRARQWRCYDAGCDTAPLPRSAPTG